MALDVQEDLDWTVVPDIDVDVADKVITINLLVLVVEKLLNEAVSVRNVDIQHNVYVVRIGGQCYKWNEFEEEVIHSIRRFENATCSVDHLDVSGILNDVPEEQVILRAGSDVSNVSCDHVELAISENRRNDQKEHVDTLNNQLITSRCL